MRTRNTRGSALSEQKMACLDGHHALDAELTHLHRVTVPLQLGQRPGLCTCRAVGQQLHCCLGLGLCGCAVGQHQRQGGGAGRNPKHRRCERVPDFPRPAGAAVCVKQSSRLMGVVRLGAMGQRRSATASAVKRKQIGIAQRAATAFWRPQMRLLKSGLGTICVYRAAPALAAHSRQQQRAADLLGQRVVNRGAPDVNTNVYQVAGFAFVLGHTPAGLVQLGQRRCRRSPGRCAPAAP